jgi:oxygen-dependent protoporphyrinogen oxidase
VGGRVQTVAKHGFLLDTGAAAAASSYVSYLSLARELGVLEDILPTSPHIGIFRGSSLHHLRLDTLFRSGLLTSLVSPRSKLRLARLALDIIRATKRGQLDYADMRKAAPLDTETAEDYALRALNCELCDYLVDPIVRTMVIADARRISKVELFSGISNIFRARICALKGGQGRIPKLLAERLDVRLQHEVTRVDWDGVRLQMNVRNSTGDLAREIFDACVIACPLTAAARICPNDAPLRALSAGLDYTQSIAVAVATRIRPASPAFLVQMPACEDGEIALMFLDHNKAADRAPAGKGLISCNWEAEASAAWSDRSDEEIGTRTLATIAKVFPELAGQIDFLHVTRWAQALPYSRVGAYQQIGDFNAGLNVSSPLQFASDYMSAAGQNTAVEFGNKAAANLLKVLTTGTEASARDGWALR